MWNDFKVGKKNKKFINKDRILNKEGVNMAKKKKNTKSKPNSKTKPAKRSKSKKTITVLALIVVIAILAVAGYIKLSKIKDQTIVAFINDEEITSEELDKSYNFLFFITGYPEEYRQIITKEVFLEQLINERLLMQETEKQGFDLGDEEIGERIEKLIGQNLLTEEQFEERLNEAGFSFDYFKNYYKNQLMLSEFLNETLFSKIEVTDSEAGEYYQTNKENYGTKQGEIRARHILVNTEEEANEVLKEIRKGTDFVELAKERSIGPSSVRGGDLGFFGKGTMAEEFEKAAFGLRIGQVSEPVQTEYGWHIIKREHGIISYEEAKELIREILLIEKQKQAFNAYLDGLKAGAEIIVNFDGVEMSAMMVKDVENTCIDNYGITGDTIIFYHADWCPHCTKMMPIVEDLEDEGYNFLWAETSSRESSVIVECFSDVIQGGIPEFICAGTNEYRLGEMSKSQLRNFADKCKS
jgi:parvulin-like peptidyl-prolyl isomerase